MLNAIRENKLKKKYEFKKMTYPYKYQVLRFGSPVTKK